MTLKEVMGQEIVKIFKKVGTQKKKTYIVLGNNSFYTFIISILYTDNINETNPSCDAIIDYSFFISISPEEDELLTSSPESSVHAIPCNDLISESSDLEVSSILSTKTASTCNSIIVNKRRNMSDNSILREVFIDSDIEADSGPFTTNSPFSSNVDRRTRYVHHRSNPSYIV